MDVAQKMGLYKRGKVWWMSFTYRGQYYRKSTETGNRKLAQRIYDKVRGEVAESRWFDRLQGENKTFKEKMDKYEAEHVSQKRSVRQYKGYIKNLRSYFKDTIISEITPSLINEYKVKRRKDSVGSATVNRDLAVLKKVFNKALREWEWVKENPVAKVSMEKEPKGRARYLTEVEFQSLYDACSNWLKPIVLTARHTGMRRENILSLKWGQVDLFRRVILLDQTKNDERLGIPLNDTMMGLFRRLSRVRHIHSPYVFCHSNGRRYVEVKTSFREALKKAEVDDFRFHDLRHCFASALVQRGVDLYLVQKLLGHKDGKMTQRYAHLASENLRDAVLKLDQAEIERNSITILSQSMEEEVNRDG